MDISSIQHSLFLSSLGNAILNSLWQACLLWIIYQTIIVSLKNPGAKLRHNLSVVFVFCSFIWFAGTFISKILITEKTPAFVQGINSLENTPAVTISPIADIFSFTSPLLPYLSVAYILLLFFLTAKLFTAYRYVYFIAHKNLINPPAFLETFASRVALQLGIPQKIKVWISSHIEVPATIGFIKPVILIPLASINHLTTLQLEAIILHELSHIKRNDYLVNLLVSIIETILFFNPFMALFIKIIKHERENCCDDYVLQYRYDPHSYASALLSLEQSRRHNLQLAMGAVSEKKQLLTRIKRITGTHTVKQFNYGQKLLALLITTGIFCSIAWLSPSEVKNEVKIIPPTKTSVDLLESQLAVIPKLKPIEAGVAKSKLSKSSKNQKKIKDLEEINYSGVNQIPEIISENKKELINPESKTPNNHPVKQEEVNNNFKNFILKNIPHIEIENINIDIDYNKIAEGTMKAYREINNINWKKIQNDFKKSLKDLKIDDLSPREKDEIIKAGNFLTLLNRKKEQLDVQKILQQIQQWPKLNTDSLIRSQKTNMNQRLRRFPELRIISGTEVQASASSTINHFRFNKDASRKLFNESNMDFENEAPMVELNGSKLKIGFQKTPSQETSPRINKKPGAYQRMIIEI